MSGYVDLQFLASSVQWCVPAELVQRDDYAVPIIPVWVFDIVSVFGSAGVAYEVIKRILDRARTDRDLRAQCAAIIALPEEDERDWQQRREIVRNVCDANGINWRIS